MLSKIFITTIFSLVLLMAGTVQAKWIAITDTRSMHDDLNGNVNSSESTKEAIGSYDKASTCLKMLRTKFTEFQKNEAKTKAVADTVESNSSWFNAQFPTIESKMFEKGITLSHTVEHFSCEEEK